MKFIVGNEDITEELKKVAEYKGINLGEIEQAFVRLGDDKKYVDAQLELLQQIIGKGKVWRFTVAHLIVFCITENINLIDIGDAMLDFPVVDDEKGEHILFTISEKEWERIALWREKNGLELRALINTIAKRAGIDKEKVEALLPEFRRWLENTLRDPRKQLQYLIVISNPISTNYYFAAQFMEFLKHKGVEVSV